MNEITIIFQACVNFWLKIKGTQDSYLSSFAVTSTSDVVVGVRVILNVQGYIAIATTWPSVGNKNFKQISYNATMGNSILLSN